MCGFKSIRIRFDGALMFAGSNFSTFVAFLKKFPLKEKYRNIWQQKFSSLTKNTNMKKAS